LPARYHGLFNLPERRSSIAVTDTADTTLGRMCAEWLGEHRGPSGVCRLDVGRQALTTRLELVELAESTIDIQSYLVRDDLSGNLIAKALLDAASRGVRVRLLMDDALTQPVDPGLLALGNEEHIEVRVFNPFPRNRSRFLSFIANFNLLNRRMHNKSFTVDNQVTIVGGRNLADEYYQSSAHSDFLDEDLLAIGEVVNEVSTGFDEFWNTIEASPIEFLGRPQTVMSADDLRREAERYIERHPSADHFEARGRLGEKLFDDGELRLVPASARLVLDHPDKVRGLVRRQLGETSAFLERLASSAGHELVIVTPYFVPLSDGVDFLAGLVKRGVRVVIVTNSLASTNHASVHAVYARYRKPLLRAGIELYELRPGLTHVPPGEFVRKTLHSKVAVVDRRHLFVGSFNLDPRSLYINTEMGMAVDSATLAGGMAESIDVLLPDLTYRLGLDEESGALVWRYFEQGAGRIVRKEPRTSLWRRIRTRLMGLLPIEEQM
jgi:putative cardiolipin synthase